MLGRPFSMPHRRLHHSVSGNFSLLADYSNSDRLTFTPSGGSDLQKITIFFAHKRVNARYCTLFNCTISGTGNPLSLNPSHAFNGNIMCHDVSDIGQYAQKSDSAAFFSTSAWTTFCLQIDTTPATPYMKVYKNEVEVASWATNTNSLQQNDYLAWMSAAAHEMGDASYFLDGYFAEVAVVAGTIYAPTVFSSGGVIQDFSGITWGTRGFWLRFQNAAALGEDSSGNGNDWTVYGSPTQSTEYPS